MKYSTLFLSCLVAGSSMAVPWSINVSDSKKGHSNNYNDIHTRALPKMSTGLPRSSPAQANSKPPARSLKISGGNGHVINGPSDRGPTDNGRPVGGGEYLPAEVVVHTKGPGNLVVNNHHRENALFNEMYMLQDHPNRKTVQGSVSASATTVSVRAGGQVTAKGYHKVYATIQNDRGTRGCIECKIAGQNLIKVDVGMGAGPVKLSVKNVDPTLGPLEIKAEQDGRGTMKATAKNHEF